MQYHLALLGELDGVVEQVEQDLAQAGDVAGNGVGNVVVDLVGQVKPLLRRPRGHEVERAFDAVTQVERLVLQLHLARFDLRKVEDVVDDGQQGVAAVADDLGELALFVVEKGVEQQAAHADDGVHRGADLVAHGGQEGALGFVSGLGQFLCGLRLFVQPGVLDGNRRLAAQANGKIKIVLGKTAVLNFVAPDREHADHLIGHRQRHEDDGVFVVIARPGDPGHARVAEWIVDDFGDAGLRHAACDPLSQAKCVVLEQVGVPAHGHPRGQRAIRLQQPDHDIAGVQHVLGAGGDLFQYLLEVERGGNLPPHLVQRCRLAGAALALVEQSCVLDGDARLSRHTDEEIEVILGERIRPCIAPD